MTPSALALSLLSLTTVFVLVLWIEGMRGARFLGGVREYGDRAIERKRVSWRERVPVINRAFFGHIFHYVIHLVLSRLLALIARIEGMIRMIAYLNRKKAQERRKRMVAVDPHLRAIAEHKEENALSDEEKHARKMAAIGEDATTATSLRRRPKK